MKKNHYFYQVYEVVSMIPSGKVSTYGAIADYLALGSARMVGWALNKCGSMTEEIIPAHRVVNSKGELSGRANFEHPEYMAEMLIADGVKVENNRIKHFKDVFWHPRELHE